MTAQALSISEIRNYMLENGGRVTNHNLVKHFKRFLTGNPEAQNEARRKFKTYVNILATIKNENNQKLLILRKKYLNECPTDETVERSLAAESNVPESPSGVSIGFESTSNNSVASPTTRQPPPYKAPPDVSTTPTRSTAQPLATGVLVQQENVESYGEVVQEFSAALQGLKRVSKTDNDTDQLRAPKTNEIKAEEGAASVEQRNKGISRSISLENDNKENDIPRFSFSSGASGTSSTVSNENAADKKNQSDAENENPISVKEATRKFNRMASEEEAKILSPPTKKKAENALSETKEQTPVSYNHPKAKEWIVSMAKANYQELAKLLNDYPELVRLADPATGYTALHWAAKHGNEDVVKLIAGTFKADVNARSNGGYTPLHMAVQFGRSDIFELLQNVYKANRDIMDWSGNKPLDYQQQYQSVSASTYKKIKARRKHAVERDLSFLRIGSLNVRVKKTTEAFSNFLGVGGNGNGAATIPLAVSHSRRPHHVHAMKTLSQPASSGQNKRVTRASMPVNKTSLDSMPKTWGSADNLPAPANTDDDAVVMPPPKSADALKQRQKLSAKRGSVGSCGATDSPRHSISSSNSSSNLNAVGYSSMPTTPNQLRSPLRSSDAANNDSDSDSACGFGSHWSVGAERNS